MITKENEAIETESEQKTNNDNLKSPEFAQAKYKQPEVTEIKEYPVPLGTQAIITTTTTALSFVPMAIKYYNSRKEQNAPKVSYSDIVDLLIYKIPDAYQILKRITYGNKLQKIVAKGELLAFAATLTPSIRNMIMQYKQKGTVTLNLDLAMHLIVFLGEVVTPFLFNSRHMRDLFTKLVIPGSSTFIMSKLFNSSNPVVREIATTLPLADLMKNKIKYIASNMKPEEMKKNSDGSFVIDDGKNVPKEKDKFDKVIDFLSGLINNKGGRYSYPEYGGGYYHNSVPYNGATASGYGGSGTVWKTGQQHL